jgi:16S rRNA (adenine1518-N6/adenine1519-N6)-dimethyltransferase
MVRAKKHLGQHFLKDEDIARRIATSLSGHGEYDQVLEVGPGTGILSKYLVEKYKGRLTLVELDKESVNYLNVHFPRDAFDIVSGDFLKMTLPMEGKDPFAVIGNFPYNISSQIFFRILELREHVPEVVGMIQKEVADRLVSPPGNKQYGILSVFLQAYYELEYLFTVEPHVFKPPPKVRSAVIRLKRNNTAALDCDEKLFRRVVKQGFQNRRKTLRNALKPLNLPLSNIEGDILARRAEQLSVGDFVELTQKLQSWRK